MRPERNFRAASLVNTAIRASQKPRSLSNLVFCRCNKEFLPSVETIAERYRAKLKAATAAKRNARSSSRSSTNEEETFSADSSASVFGDITLDDVDATLRFFTEGNDKDIVDYLISLDDA